jgi:hypothetical protein
MPILYFWNEKKLTEISEVSSVQIDLKEGLVYISTLKSKNLLKKVYEISY